MPTEVLVPKLVCSLLAFFIGLVLTCLAVENRQKWNEHKHPAFRHRSESYFEYAMAVGICSVLYWMFEALYWFIPIPA